MGESWVIDGSVMCEIIMGEIWHRSERWVRNGKEMGKRWVRWVSD